MLQAALRHRHLPPPRHQRLLVLRAPPRRLRPPRRTSQQVSSVRCSRWQSSFTHSSGPRYPACTAAEPATQTRCPRCEAAGRILCRRRARRRLRCGMYSHFDDSTFQKRRPGGGGCRGGRVSRCQTGLVRATDCTGQPTTSLTCVSRHQPPQHLNDVMIRGLPTH